jgi:two-component system NtrC family sensor kinase
VFLNILNNAVDAVLEHAGRGNIWIRTCAAGERLVVEFMDSGPGVQEPARVFDPFYTTKPVGKGTGLGLSICYGIVTEHGGSLQVRNEPPLGAAFQISFPIMPVAEEPGDGPAALTELATKARILLVDDEETVLDLEQEILRGRCQWTRAARSGQEALEILKREPVDLVITDLKMPGEISGREIYDWVKQHRPELASRIIFTMSDSHRSAVQELLAATGCLHIQKPFHLQEFLNLIRQALKEEPAGAH